MKNLQRLNLTVTNPTFSAGGTSRILLDRIPGIRRIGTTYLRRIVLVFRGTFTSDAGAGNLTLTENRAHDIIDRLELRINGRSWPVIDLQQNAGSLMHKFLHFTKGRRLRSSGGTVNGAGGGDITVAEAGTAVRLVIEVPFCNPWGLEPDDWNLPLAMLQNQCELLIGWHASANAGMFGAGMDAGGNVAGTLSAFAQLVERDELRIPQFYSLQRVNLGSLQDQIPIAGRVLHMLLECAINSTGLATAAVSDANRTTINVKVDGHDVTAPAMTSRDMILDWVLSFPKARAEEILDQEAGVAPFIPWFFPLQDYVKVTHLPVCVGQPQFIAAGTSATPSLLVLTTELNLKDPVMNEVNRSGLQVPDGFRARPELFVSPKVAGKGFAKPGTDVAARVPLKIEREARAAA